MGGIIPNRDVECECVSNRKLMEDFRVKRLKKLICLIVAVVTLSSAVMANACTVVAAGKDATADGSTMVTHTCDGRYDNRVQIVPGGTHEEGEVVEIYRDPCMDTIYPVEKVGEIPRLPRPIRTSTPAIPASMRRVSPSASTPGAATTPPSTTVSRRCS